MIVEELALRNYRCYEEATVGFEPGVTVVQGRNGSGKTSLLEATFVALYGSDALDSDEVLADVVTNGAEEGSVSLGFRQAGDRYRVTQEFRMADDDRATTRKSVLERNGEQLGDDGITSTRREIQSLLRMDAEAFVNCAYVRQGEINKLIEASPEERQRVIDELLQLGTLEEYRERASDARVGVKRVRRRLEDRIEDLGEQIDEIEEREPHEALAALEERRDELEEAISERETALENAREEERELEATVEDHEEIREELEEVAETVDELKEAIHEHEQEKEEHREAIAEREERIEELEEEIDEALAEEDADDAEAALAAAEDALDDVEDAIADAEAAVEGAETEREGLADRIGDLQDRREAVASRVEEAEQAVEDADAALDEVDDEIASVRDEIENIAVEDPVEDARETVEEAKDERAELVARVEALDDAIASDEELVEQGVCPTCEQEIDGDHRHDAIAEKREERDELADEVEDVEARIEALERRLERAREREELEDELERLEQRREDLEERRDESAERRDDAAEERDEVEKALEEAREGEEEIEEALEEHRDRLEELAEEREDAEARVERCEALVVDAERVEELERAIAEHEKDVERLDDAIEEKTERLADLRERRSALEDELGDMALDEVRERLAKIERYVDEKSEQKAALEAELRGDPDDPGDDGVIGRIGERRNAIERLEALRERRDGLEDDLAGVASLHEETEELEAMYRDLRAELRRTNVRRLDELLGEIFDMIYTSDSYAGVELDEDYELTVYEKDGEPLDPKHLSGGERAVFNLSLRCAIYRLLVEGIGGGATPLPPLILDEPTTFLDDQHVARLIDLIRTMHHDFGVEQVIVVSHDEELLDAADHRIAVEKDPTTNRSTVRVEEESGDAMARLGAATD